MRAVYKIYDNDPNALERLREKLDALEQERDRYKRYNASCRKGQRDVTILTDSEQDHLLSLHRSDFCRNYQMPGGRLPKWLSANLSGNIKRVRDRIERLERG